MTCVDLRQETGTGAQTSSSCILTITFGAYVFCWTSAVICGTCRIGKHNSRTIMFDRTRETFVTLNPGTEASTPHAWVYFSLRTKKGDGKILSIFLKKSISFELCPLWESNCPSWSWIGGWSHTAESRTASSLGWKARTLRAHTPKWIASKTRAKCTFKCFPIQWAFLRPQGT